MIATLPDGNSPLYSYENFAEVDFIVTDLDGTLIVGELPVLKQIKDSIARLKRKQIQVTVATGRTYCGAKARIQELGISSGMPVALYNGGLVVEYRTGNILHADYIPCEVIQDLLRIIDLHKNTIYVYGVSSAMPFFSGDKDDYIKEEVYAWGRIQKDKDVNGMTIRRVQVGELLEKKISAILIENNMSLEEKQIIKGELQQYSCIRITDSGSGFMEIKGGGGSKGKDKGIINDILKSEKYSARKILAIGDNDNDVELFKTADISVAVGNTSDLAREYADYVCERNSAEGFYDMLKVLENAKRYYGEKGKEWKA